MKMAQPFRYAAMTKEGIKLLNNAQSGECVMEFTRIAVGDGQYSEEEKNRAELEKMNALKHEKASYEILSKKKQNDNAIILTTNISNYDVEEGKALITEGFYINEIAVFAREKDSENEVMYSIAVVDGENGDYMPPYNGYNPAQIVQSYLVSVNNAEEAKIVVQPGAYALQQDLIDTQKELEKVKESTESIANALLDKDAVTKAFESVFSYIGGGGESEQAMDEQDILNAINTEWNGESSENPNALSASDIMKAINTEWNGESSENPNALSAEEIYKAIENAEKE